MTKMVEDTARLSSTIHAPCSICCRIMPVASRFSTCTWSSWPPLLGFTSSSSPLRSLSAACCFGCHPTTFGRTNIAPPPPPPPPPPQNQEPESSSLFGPPHLVKTVKRIPRASQDIAARKMATILQDIISLNDAPSWNGLYHFTTRCLQTPKRGGRRRSLATRSTGQFVTKWTQRYQHPPANANHRFEPLYNL